MNVELSTYDRAYAAYSKRVKQLEAYKAAIDAMEALYWALDETPMRVKLGAQLRALEDQRWNMQDRVNSALDLMARHR